REAGAPTIPGRNQTHHRAGRARHRRPLRPRHQDGHRLEDPGYQPVQHLPQGPRPGVKAQVQMYGLGFEQAGLPVERVAIALLPRGKTLRSLHVWSADYDPDLAVAALTRRDAVLAMLADFDVKNNPDRYTWFPIEPYDCVFCPWFSPRPTSALACKGDQ